MAISFQVIICSSFFFILFSQSSSSESGSLLKHSGYGRLTSRGQISQSMNFIADSPDSPLSSMTSTNSFFTSVSRQKGRPVMPSVSNGVVRYGVSKFHICTPIILYSSLVFKIKPGFIKRLYIQRTIVFYQRSPQQ